jgi:hypothetical protein
MASFLLQLIRSRWAHYGALLVVLLAVGLPPDRGFGVPLCQFRVVTHLPCLACGLTRSFIALAHLDPARAAFYHPLGLILFPLTLALAALLAAPPARQLQVAAWVEARQRAWNRFGIGLLVVFIIYGLGRIGWLLATHRASPW